MQKDWVGVQDEEGFADYAVVRTPSEANAFVEQLREKVESAARGRVPNGDMPFGQTADVQVRAGLIILAVVGVDMCIWNNLPCMHATCMQAHSTHWCHAKLLDQSSM